MRHSGRVTSPHFEAVLHLRTSEQGGRKRPIFDTARANCDNGDYMPNSAPHEHDVMIRFETPQQIAPGESAAVTLVPARPEFWRMVGPGAWVIVKEGGRVIGVAEVIAVKPDGGS